MVIVLMGPAGAGKSTLGAALADRVGWRFVDADSYHSAANRSRMQHGTPLTDDDRAGWLAALRAAIAAALDRRENMVLACSALTRAHRAALAGGFRQVRFVYLKVGRQLLRQRLESRRGHYAGASLLDSQLDTLEEPDPSEALVIDGSGDLDTLIGHIRLEFGF